MKYITRLFSFVACCLFLASLALPGYSQTNTQITAQTSPQTSAPPSNQSLGGFDDVFSNQEEFLKVDQAFVFDFNQADDTLSLSFTIADGYYLYKKQFKLVAKQAAIGEPHYPKGVIIEDEYFGESEVFYDEVTITVPITQATNDGIVKIRYQGCADAGLCYAPNIKTVYLNALASNANASVLSNSADPMSTDEQSLSQTNPSSSQASQYSLADKLINKENLALTLVLFFALGIGLAFTPCVFPMYPIVSGIVIGQGKQAKASNAFWLTFTYVQGMAITYSILGLIVASAGMQFQAALQHPLILGIFIGIFVLLALAMFGRYELQLPAKWQTRLTNLSNNQTPGSMAGVFAMGALSGLIASPCTTAPLTGILLFIAQSGDLTLGFVSLYVLSIGMGVPLIIFGVTGSKLLPKAGQWMNVVKVSFGFMMLSVAIVFVERLWPKAWSSEYINLLWAALGLGAFGYYFVVNEASQKGILKYVRTLVIAAGLFASALLAYNTLTSSEDTATQHSQLAHPTFIVVENLDDLRQQIATANSQGKTVMVDLYADWCVACKEFEIYTFPDPNVINALNNTVWMQIDLTDTSANNTAFQDEFSILGLPTILFFDESGNELTQSRVTGFMKAPAFAEHVENTF
ncbi:protein-disulfide reductase DsbD [Alteromonas sp. KS69]|jgi:thiol:disulfide interchange protein DsbD|uniref:protein-disulfide reductase DsbD n=1 Tax=Alteromonas sp. KS69 TaxID=2109917 RepID=UPI000C370569|nr:protein-disulfide reductase DsbD [Alteromonas sp. KS69]MBB67903.1 protein-disulfide reductase DsbD [Rickettsiales bacterium]RUP82094.1 protein-disulfide reductase DsbD [Alteromonas sp. KS69]|tara:strand:- start:4132 stop:6030 length:1899 start_codon:yes stop_codon:yes gene_type:complete